MKATLTRWRGRSPIRSRCTTCTGTYLSGARTCMRTNFREGLIRWFPPGTWAGSSGAAAGTTWPCAAGRPTATSFRPTTDAAMNGVFESPAVPISEQRVNANGRPNDPNTLCVCLAFNLTDIAEHAIPTIWAAFPRLSNLCGYQDAASGDRRNAASFGAPWLMSAHSFPDSRENSAGVAHNRTVIVALILEGMHKRSGE